MEFENKEDFKVPVSNPVWHTLYGLAEAAANKLLASSCLPLGLVDLHWLQPQPITKHTHRSQAQEAEDGYSDFISM